ncbi:MAG TPA: (deoxy)nucleoside triphosphate pyrophosphohydrolase [bacterium]|jgi:8-oxo-dGTP diphosphatase|nr:(deoxy)nucleoside triphosphate pyrophosphohydrolase [bacterium]HNT66251.1 (deoxy)nucleoside triphosphate pyrophosphohydrolase [bacterium]HOX86788.1 (deoxy)nucleoside triphosphate pyrophosphohydrolase [bacterium]HPG46943.1 (deoxy)nucleoside triphosphate pyrophosphohydrolase [bacterium]HPM99307.1 (deoxy)nucleoside triphosphate pyrophosphohydrolase [bacterium]
MDTNTQIVVAAAIVADGRVLVAQRGNGAMAGKWEFPGGKKRIDESPQKALVREIREELSLSVQVSAKIGEEPFDVDGRSYLLMAYLAEVQSGTLNLSEHQAVRWVTPPQLLEMDLASADIAIAQKVIALLSPNDTLPPTPASH